MSTREIYKTLPKLYSCREFLEDQLFTTLLRFYIRCESTSCLRLREEICPNDEKALYKSVSLLREQISRTTNLINEQITLLEMEENYKGSKE